MSLAGAEDLLQMHKDTYQKFWKWSDAVLNYVMTHNELESVFGWRISIKGSKDVNSRSLRNFPMQANGAEILRLACYLAYQKGVSVCAPVHDALLIEAPIEELDEHIKLTQQAMSNASSVVLDGFRLNSDVKKFTFPQNYLDADDGGKEMWDRVWRLLDEHGY